MSEGEEAKMMNVDDDMVLEPTSKEQDQDEPGVLDSDSDDDSDDSEDSEEAQLHERVSQLRQQVFHHSFGCILCFSYAHDIQISFNPSYETYVEYLQALHDVHNLAELRRARTQMSESYPLGEGI